MRVRKTVDTWEIHVDYGFGEGWEHEDTEFSEDFAKICKKWYYDEGYHVAKIVRRRMKVADMSITDLMNEAKAIMTCDKPQPRSRDDERAKDS